jgi:hypothetical protein
MNVSENGGYVSWCFTTHSIKLLLRAVTPVVEGRERACITNSLSMGNCSGNSRCGLRERTNNQR